MKTLIIGANGKIGQKLAAKLKNSAHPPVLMLRDQTQVDKYDGQGYETVLADLEKDFNHAFKGIEAVVFTAGSGAHTGKDKTHLVDRIGAKKAIDEAIKHKVNRFVLVSALGADKDPSVWPAEMEHYYAAKADADKYLLQTGLDYTILMPGRLTDGNGSGTIRLGDKIEKKSGSISRVDVASVIVHLLDAKSTYKRALELLEGDLPINKAIEQL
ncbi:MAG: SDR family oxidoreductase [Bacteroidota bacterium]